MFVVALLLVVVALTALYIIRANRRAFDEVEGLSPQLRNLSWRMLRMQEDLQQEFAGSCTTSSARSSRRWARCWAASSGTCRPSPRSSETSRKSEPSPSRPWRRSGSSRVYCIPWSSTTSGSRRRSSGSSSSSAGSMASTRGSRRADRSASCRPKSTIHIYRIVQEALTNVSRHARTSDAWVRLSQTEGVLDLEVEDQGKGLANRARSTRCSAVSASSACASARS